MPTEPIDTIGVTVEEAREATRPAEARDIPVYTVARAVEWLKRPENAPKIEHASKVAGEAVREVAQGIDREVTKLGRVFVEIATNEEEQNNFWNSLLETMVGRDK